MSVIADNAAAKLTIRLQAIPEQLRAVSELADADPHPAVVRARSFRRFSTRRLMILVAIAALFLSVARVWHNRLYCQQRAAYHAAMAELHRGRLPANMSSADAARLFAGVRRRPELAIHHSRMKVKWQNAAVNPWLRVEADPP
jgi:hypothetical protein